MLARSSWLLLALVAGCGGSGSGGSAGSGGRITVVPNVVAGSSGVGSGSASAQHAPHPEAVPLGSATLQSLKYYITNIQICEDVVQMGSGYSSASGCLDLYSQPSDSSQYESYGVAQARDDNTPGHYVDLMTADGQAALRKPVVLDVPVAAPGAASDDGGVGKAGVYRYGLINFFRPIKVTAQFPLLDGSGQYFRTRAITQITSGLGPDGQHSSDRVQIGDTLSGPTEETTYMLNNGGALFTFQQPFTITQADLDAQREITIDLVFNPDNFGQAYATQSDCTTSPYVAICDPLNQVVLDMPYVHMSPVPRKVGQTTHKETYLVDYDDNAKLRVELYYNDADGEAGVQGVDSAVVYQSAATMPVNDIIASSFVSQSGSVTTGDAVVTLMDYTHAPSVTGLGRRQNGTATIHCVYTGGLCQTTGTQLTKSYVFVGDSVVAAN